MRPMLTPEFEKLYDQYRNAQTSEERMIRMQLNILAQCYSECQADDRDFADRYTTEFCKLVQLLLQEQRQIFDAAKTVGDDFSQPMDLHHSFVAYRPQRTSFQSSEELLCAFEKYLQEKKNAQGKQPSPTTIKDYLARIRTFANKYIWEDPRLCALWREEQGSADPILFTYQYLELALGGFETKGQQGIDKQKLNIRSALRNLSDFKRTIENR